MLLLQLPMGTEILDDLVVVELPLTSSPSHGAAPRRVRAIALVLALQIRVWFAHELVQMMQCAHPYTIPDPPRTGKPLS